MISNPNLVFYTCISRGTTILAEFNSQNADLGTLAVKCLEKTPNHHRFFSHTVLNRSYTFLIDDPFVYFAIYDKKLEHPECLFFLRSVKEAFDEIHLYSNTFSESKLTSHCYQGEFNPVFHQLLSSPMQFESPKLPQEVLKITSSRSLGLPKGCRRFGSMPLLGSVSPGSLKKKKKKKRFSNADCREGLFENKLDFSDRSIVLSRDLSMSMMNSPSSHKAKRVWKRHVWVVLTLDLVICLILFGVWLWICRGFKCING